MNVFAIPMPEAVIRRGDVIGLMTGLLSFPVSLYAGSLEGALARGPGMVVLPIVTVSSLASAVASAFTNPSQAPNVGGMPMRVGVRAGFLAALVGGAFAVFASTLHSFGIGSPMTASIGYFPIREFLPATAAGRVILLALLALPPSIFFGLIGALLAEMLKNPPPAVGDGSQTPTPSREHSTVFITAITIIIACYLSPLLVVFKPRPKPARVVIATPRLSTPLPAPSPLPPKWRYRKPDTFNSIEPSRIAIVERRELGEISPQRPVAMSPNGLRFAYFTRKQARWLNVADLETLDVIASAETTDEPANLAWSPDSRRLFFATEGERKSLVVFDVESSQMIFLPKPIDVRVPAGRPLWWDEDDIFFVAGSATLSVLNLDTLRVVPTDESPTWKAVPEVTREVLKAGVLSHLPGNPRWQMRVESAVRRYDVPVRPDGPWTFGGSMNLVLVSPQNAYRVTLSGVDVRLGDDLVASPDGSKIIRIRDGAASIFFLGLHEESANQCNITMPEAPDASVSGALAKNRICAFVCGPLINPLNRKTVGPDRERVKAIVRFMKWEGTSARFWVAEEYEPVGTGDVVADLHTWEARRPASAKPCAHTLATSSAMKDASSRSSPGDSTKRRLFTCASQLRSVLRPRRGRIVSVRSLKRIEPM